jgi:hypothetical protein
MLCCLHQLYLFVELITTVRIRPPGSKPRPTDGAAAVSKGNDKGATSGGNKGDDKIDPPLADDPDVNKPSGEAKSDGHDGQAPPSPSRRGHRLRSPSSSMDIDRIANGAHFRDSREFLRASKDAKSSALMEFFEARDLVRWIQHVAGRTRSVDVLPSAPMEPSHAFSPLSFSFSFACAAVVLRCLFSHVPCRRRTLWRCARAGP